MSKSKLTWCAVGVWAVAIVGGVCLFDGYDLRAALTSPASERWPLASALQPIPGVPTLVMALHPKCPCSTSTLSELEGVLVRRNKRVNVYLLVYKPKLYPKDWTMTSLVEHAQHIPGVNVIFDQGGKELKKFHARASGELWFYDGAGRLRFSGGITGGRGHAGRNTGISSLVSLLGGGSAVVENAPVFGCAIGGEGHESAGSDQ